MPPTCLGQDAQSSTPSGIASEEVEQAQRRVAELEARQEQLLNDAQNVSRDQNQAPGRQHLAEQARAMARLEAEIKRQDEFSRRPRKKFVGTRGEAFVFAPYLENWRQKTISVGMQNYPAQARGKLYGSVVVYVELNASDGSLHSVEVSRPSGEKILDDAAIAFIRKAAPYGPVPREAMGDAQILCFAETLQFVRSEEQPKPKR